MIICFTVFKILYIFIGDFKMAKQKTINNKPDYIGKIDVAGWVKQDKNGNDYIDIKLNNFVRLFTNLDK